MNSIEERLTALEKVVAPVREGLTLEEAKAEYGEQNLEIRVAERNARNFRPMADSYMVNDFRLGQTIVKRVANRITAIRNALPKRPGAAVDATEPAPMPADAVPEPVPAQ